MTQTAMTFTTLICSLLLQSPGDVTGDGRVDSGDLAVLAQEWLTKAPNAPKGCQYYAVEPQTFPLHIDCCDEVDGWVFENVALSTVSTWEGQRAYLCGDKYLRSILVQKTPGKPWGYLSKSFEVPMDLSGCAMDVRVKIPQGSGTSSYEHILSLHIRFVDEAGNYAQYALPASSPGWQRRCCTRTDAFEAGGSLDWRRIASYSIGLLTKGAEYDPAAIIDRIVVFKSILGLGGLFDSPIVINTFDDGAVSHYDAAAYLSGRCLRGTFYVVGETVQQSARLTLAELQDMHWAGHLVANHTWSHLLPFREQTPDEQIWQVTEMQAFMSHHGFGDGARILSLPGNEWTAPVRDLLLPYVDHVRGNPGGFAYQRNPMIQPATLSPSATLDNIRQEIERALEPDEPPSIVVLMEHDLTDRMDDFKAYVDYLAIKRDSGVLSVYRPIDLLTSHN